MEYVYEIGRFKPNEKDFQMQIGKNRSNEVEMIALICQLNGLCKVVFS